MKAPRQRCTVRLANCALWLTFLVCWPGGAGCRGIYQESRAIYPADPCARVELRVDQACQAERRAEQAVARLRDRFANGLEGEHLAPDIDRLEMTARELSRCVAAISDAAAACKEAHRFEADEQRLQRHSTQLLEATDRIRNEGLPSSLPQLDRLLLNASPPSISSKEKMN